MLSDATKQSIQQAYRQFLESKGWVSRHGQRVMIADIARTLGNIEHTEDGRRTGTTSHICVVEAGTGTGKTVAYSLATIPLAQELKKTLVISTATVALQEQITLKDLPDLRKHAGLDFDFALAKGRARYLCPAKLDTQLEGADFDPTLALYPDELPPQNSPGTVALFQEMAQALASNRWDGDRDAWPKHIDSQDWMKVTTDHRQCHGRRCAYISQCPFYKARDQVQGVDVVVANHDLVLADLALGGGAILPDPAACIYIFDEGHHLADKAINHFASQTRVEGTRKWLKQAEKTYAAMNKVLGGGIGGTGALIEKLHELAEQTQEHLATLFHLLQDNIVFPDTAERRNKSAFQKQRRFRFGHGVVPGYLQQSASILAQQFSQIVTLLSDVNEHVKEALDDSTVSSIPRHELEAWYPAIGMLLARAESNLELWLSFARVEEQQPITPTVAPMARWVTALEDNNNFDFELCASPIQAANRLADTLWSRCYGAVVTSATLTALKRFDRFRMRSGTPEDAHYVAIQSPFDFSRATLELPAEACDPANGEEHTSRLATYLRDHLDWQAGSLVLFSSRRQMEDVYDALDRDLHKKILLQGDLSKQEMINEHKKRLDRGEGNVLFGLASFAEGVDLPGKYCTQVVIAKLPFAVPDDPVEEAMAEWIETRGGNPFMELAVPDTAMKLVQACGRLLRNEQDSGIITLFDNRVVTKRYGRAILDSLPPYRRRLTQTG